MVIRSPRAALELSSGCLGPALGLSWDCLGPVSGSLGQSWVCPGPVLRPCKSLVKPRSLDLRKTPKQQWLFKVFGSLRAALELSFGCPGLVLGLSWAVLGLSWTSCTYLGLSWTVLGLSWTILGPGGRLGTFRDRLGTMLGSILGPKIGCFYVMLGVICWTNF